MSNASDFRILGGILNKYMGDKKDVVIPDGLTAIESKAFAECRKIKSVTIPASINHIRHSAFENCKALANVKLHDGELAIADYAFKGCNKLNCIRGLGVTYIGDIFAITKKNEVVIPLIFPKVSLSSVKNVYYKISLTMGYVLEPSLYTGRGLNGNKKYLADNRDLILEAAKRHGIDAVVTVLEPGGEAQMEEDEVGIDQMSVAAAKELFDIQSKTSGVKILWYKGSEEIVDIPRVIGKTAVALVSPDAFTDDKIVRCNAKTFEKLSPAVQFNTYQAFLSGNVKFSAEQTSAMKTYFSKKVSKLLEAAVELQRADMVGMLLIHGKLMLEEYNALIEKATENGNAAITAALVDARNKAYTSEDVENAENIAVEKALGIRELTLEDYKEIFKLSKRRDYVTGECWVLIRGCKKIQPYVEIPGTIEGMPVHLDRDAFNNDKVLEEIVLHEGVVKIDMNALFNCPNLRTVQIPSTVTEIADGTFGGNNLLEINVSQDNAHYASWEGMLCDKDLATLLRCPAGKQGALKLPSGLTCIKDYAFAYCKKLTEIVIPVTVERIGGNAFSLTEKFVMVDMEYVAEWPFMIHAPAGSFAETFAKNKKIPFVAE